MEAKQVAGYVASAVAIIGGGAMLYVPPAGLAHDAVIGLAFSLITGGFAGLGVTVAVPAVTRAARTAGELEGRRAAAAGRPPPTP
jgi:hypothetical protein